MAFLHLPRDTVAERGLCLGVLQIRVRIGLVFRLVACGQEVVRLIILLLFLVFADGVADAWIRVVVLIVEDAVWYMLELFKRIEQCCILVSFDPS